MTRSLALRWVGEVEAHFQIEGGRGFGTGLGGTGPEGRSPSQSEKGVFWTIEKGTKMKPGESEECE